METRHIACNACGADRFVPLSTVDGWRIGRCGACGLVYVDPTAFFAPTDEFAEMSKGFEYTEYMHQPVSDEIAAFERRQLLSNAKEIAQLRGSNGHGSDAAAGPLRYLDVGCGSGASVRAAADLGWSAVGLDLDPQLIAEGREGLGVDIRCTSILESGLPDAAFDLIKLRDVMEHLPDPYEVLVEIRRLLAPGGLALLVTPNEAGLATRTKVALRRPRRVVATVPPPHHLHSFAPATMARILRRAGLRPIRALTTTPTDWRYVTSHNLVRAQTRPVAMPLWSLGKALGMGAVLVVWASADAA